MTGTANKSITKIIAQGIKDKLDYKELVHQLYELLDDDRAELLVPGTNCGMLNAWAISTVRRISARKPE